MANIKSAQKRISTIERRNNENRFVRATLSTKIKKFRKMIEQGNIAEAEAFSKEVYSYIDSACSKGVIHKNTASRKVGRLASALYKAKTSTPAEVKVEAKEEVKPEVKDEVVEAPAKKTTTRKTAAKKVADSEEKPAKKTTTRKTAAKKAADSEEKPAKKTTTKKTTAKAE